MRFIVIIFVLVYHVSNCQDINDAINYSFENQIGNSRFTSMSGAFGALGGNLSAISINPASSSVFEISRFGGSIALESNKLKSNFLENENSEKESTLHYQGGIVYVFKDYSDGKLDKFSFGINYQTQNSFNDRHLITGQSDKSVDEFFINNSAGVNLSDISVNNNESISSVYRWLGNNYGYYAQQAFLGYQSYLLDYNESTNKFYSLARYANGLNLENNQYKKGSKNKASLNISGSFNKRLYVGFNLNIYDLNINKENIHVENNFDTNSAIKLIDFRNYLTSSGIGVSLQAGLIYKLNNFRLGLSYDSPTWFNFEDQLEQSLEVHSLDSVTNELYVDIVDPRIINIYEYNFKTPSKLTLSVASVIKNMLIFSFDLESKNYSKSKFSSENSSAYDNLNLAISKNLNKVLNLRFGTELRINQLSFRAGIKRSNNPYDSSLIKLESNTFGIGYQFDNSSIDIGFSSNKIKNDYQLFDTGLTKLAKISKNQILSVISYNVIF